MNKDYELEKLTSLSQEELTEIFENMSLVEIENLLERLGKEE